MKAIQICFVIAMIASSVSAQPPDSLWTRTFGGADHDQAYSVQQTADGGYILAGWTRSFGAGNYDMWLVKTDANGDSLWSRTFGGPAEDRALSVQQVADGYVLAGRTMSFGAGDEDMWLVKTDLNGDSLWSHTFGGTNADRAYVAQQTSDGGYIVAGNTASFGVGDIDMWLVKTDGNGDSLWSRSFGSSAEDWCNSAIQAEDGSYVLAGYTTALGTPDGWMVKSDANGDSLWSRRFVGDYTQTFREVEQTVDGGYVLAGVTTVDMLTLEMWLVKTDADGDSLWTRRFGGEWGDEAYSVEQNADGEYILVGLTENFGAEGASDLYAVQASGDGQLIWSRRWGGQGLELAYCVRLTADGGYALAGYTDSWHVNNRDVWLLKVGGADIIAVTSPNGGEQWRVMEPQTVTWTSNLLNASFRLELNRNYPTGPWEALVDSTEDDGEEEVWITAPLSSDCRVRVSLIGDTLSDVSDGDFSLSNSAGILRLIDPAQPDVPVDSWFAGVINAPDTVSATFRFKNFGLEPVTLFPPEEPVTDAFAMITDCADTVTLTTGEMSSCAVTLLFHPIAEGSSYDTLLVCTNASNGQGGFVRILLEGELITSVGQPSAVPKSFALHSVYPNPFNTSATIRYDLPVTSNITLAIYDVTGRAVAILVRGERNAGTHTEVFDGSACGSGVYVCRLRAGTYEATQKVVLLK